MKLHKFDVCTYPKPINKLLNITSINAILDDFNYNLDGIITDYSSKDKFDAQNYNSCCIKASNNTSLADSLLPNPSIYHQNLTKKDMNTSFHEIFAPLKSSCDKGDTKIELCSEIPENEKMRNMDVSCYSEHEMDPSILPKKENSIKKPLNAFIHFMKQKKADNPDKFTGLESTIANKLLGMEWRALAEEEKSPFKIKAAEDRAEYEKFISNNPSCYIWDLKKKKSKKAKNVCKQQCSKLGSDRIDDWCYSCQSKKACHSLCKKIPEFCR